ncbi:hypothetical protein L226DRAFT_101605 [Lentinus tigrinus ALCF2SS1-7]|uniref:uncharacterized protein n=1 Tax=Lentinus tigrinus ALCF2SS1-7 TaxID=1328758 RepID=UPI001165DBBA|nr:hypothetical protein L226DRAFT_101605 [Lentinus tigrinus ALCF2SS1-7]
MPPKRKRAEDSIAEAAPRATRTSSRLKSSSSGTNKTTPAPLEKAKQPQKEKADGGTEVREFVRYCACRSTDATCRLNQPPRRQSAQPRRAPRRRGRG